MIRRAAWAVAAALLSLPWWRVAPDLGEDAPLADRCVNLTVCGAALCLSALLVAERFAL